ncbi:hypothetical protein F5H01DRAFT_2012 [Linnemannia elongata]|nr:hypothetical protein F5H01DRAFT_2012 [Linnemannia elongata]
MLIIQLLLLQHLSSQKTVVLFFAGRESHNYYFFRSDLIFFFFCDVSFKNEGRRKSRAEDFFFLFSPVLYMRSIVQHLQSSFYYILRVIFFFRSFSGQEAEDGRKSCFLEGVWVCMCVCVCVCERERERERERETSKIFPVKKAQE